MWIKTQPHLSKAKQILDPAHRELVETGFLSSAEWSALDETPESWFITYSPGPRAVAEMRRARGEELELPEPTLSEEQEALISALERRGVIRGIAEQLVRKHDPEKIRQVIRYTDWYRKQPNRVKNWGAYIAELIKDPHFSPSPEFEKQRAIEEEMERRRAIEEEARRILEERLREALRNWSNERMIEEKLERAVKVRKMLVEGGMAEPYTPEEIEELRREIAKSLPKTEEGRREWLLRNMSDKFNLESIIKEIEEKGS